MNREEEGMKEGKAHMKREEITKDRWSGVLRAKVTKGVLGVYFWSLYSFL
jgi:hypothetical protein